MGKCAEFIHGTTGLGNYRAGSECPFSPGDRNRFADDKLIRSRIHGDTGLGRRFRGPTCGTG